MRTKTVKVNFYLGDGRDVSSSVGICGFKNQLKRELENDVKRRFQPFCLPRPWEKRVRGDILRVSPNPSKCRWNYAVSLKTRFRHDISERASDDLTTLIAYLHLFHSAYYFTIVPLSWRHPQRVAAGTLFSIWFLAYFSDQILRRNDKRFPMEFTLAATDSLQPYTDLLDRNCEGLWNYIEAVWEAAPVVSFWKTPPNRDAVKFHLTTLLIP